MNSYISHLIIRIYTKHMLCVLSLDALVFTLRVTFLKQSTVCTCGFSRLFLSKSLFVVNPTSHQSELSCCCCSLSRTVAILIIMAQLSAPKQILKYFGFLQSYFGKGLFELVYVSKTCNTCRMFDSLSCSNYSSFSVSLFLSLSLTALL